MAQRSRDEIIDQLRVIAQQMAVVPEILRRLEEIEPKVEELMTIRNKATGAFAVLAVLASIFGAVGSVIKGLLFR